VRCRSTVLVPRGHIPLLASLGAHEGLDDCTEQGNLSWNQPDNQLQAPCRHCVVQVNMQQTQACPPFALRLDAGLRDMQLDCWRHGRCPALWYLQ
jgi:hypothetical protein